MLGEPVDLRLEDVRLSIGYGSPWKWRCPGAQAMVGSQGSCVMASMSGQTDSSSSAGPCPRPSMAAPVNSSEPLIISEKWSIGTALAFGTPCMST